VNGLKTKITVLVSDITKLHVDAIVNAANKKFLGNIKMIPNN
jgi:O-acetyl-ADP-ribose deacetylase (regulator of RNase III)